MISSLVYCCETKQYSYNFAEKNALCIEAMNQDAQVPDVVVVNTSANEIKQSGANGKVITLDRKVPDVVVPMNALEVTRNAERVDKNIMVLSIDTTRHLMLNDEVHVGATKAGEVKMEHAYFAAIKGGDYEKIDKDIDLAVEDDMIESQKTSCEKLTSNLNLRDNAVRNEVGTVSISVLKFKPETKSKITFDISAIMKFKNTPTKFTEAEQYETENVKKKYQSVRNELYY